jgi:hypothetical protein
MELRHSKHTLLDADASVWLSVVGRLRRLQGTPNYASRQPSRDHRVHMKLCTRLCEQSMGAIANQGQQWQKEHTIVSNTSIWKILHHVKVVLHMCTAEASDPRQTLHARQVGG